MKKGFLGKIHVSVFRLLSISIFCVTHADEYFRQPKVMVFYFGLNLFFSFLRDEYLGCGITAYISRLQGEKNTQPNM